MKASPQPWNIAQNFGRLEIESGPDAETIVPYAANVAVWCIYVWCGMNEANRVVAETKKHLGTKNLTREMIRPLAYTEEFHAIVERVYGTRNRHSLQLGWASLLKATEGTDGAA